MTPARRAGIAILLGAFLFVALIGGTDAGRYLTSIRAITAVIGAGFVVFWILRSGHDSDAVDFILLAALCLFLVACVASNHLRDSFDAATTALAFASAAFVARGASLSVPQRNLGITALALCGLVLSASFAFVWGMSWFQWIRTTGGELPPLDLILPVGPYRHYHVVGTTIAVLLPALFVIVRRAVIWPLAALGICCSGIIVVMSGSRSVWLALMGGLIVAGGMKTAQGTLNLSRRWWLGVASGAGLAVVVVLITGMAGPIMTRLLGSSTVALRGALWSESVGRWLIDPVFGAGPGSFSTEITLSGFFATYDGIGRHADNAVIQVLAEAGLLGLTSLGLVVAAVVLGLRRGGWPPAPTIALAIFGLTSLTDNPTDSAHLVVIAVAWFALGAPRGGTGNPLRGRGGALMRAGSFAAAAVIAIASTSVLAASWAYDQARALRAGGDDAGVKRALSDAVSLDPSFALYHRELGLALLAAGNRDGASAQVQLAAQLNPGDLTALRMRAYLAVLRGDLRDATDAANRVVELGGVRAVNSLTQAYVASASHDLVSAEQALVRALRFDPWLPAAPGWGENFPTGADLETLLAEASDAWAATGNPTGRNTMAQAWIHGMVGKPSPGDGITADAATNATLRCDLPEVDRILRALSDDEGRSVKALIARLMAARIEGQDATEVLLLMQLRWPLLGHMATNELSAASPFTDPDEDARIYRRLGMPAVDFGPLLPTADGGLSAWLRDPVGAADTGAPGSGLASCR